MRRGCSRPYNKSCRHWKLFSLETTSPMTQCSSYFTDQEAEAYWRRNVRKIGECWMLRHAMPRVKTLAIHRETRASRYCIQHWDAPLFVRCAVRHHRGEMMVETEVIQAQDAVSCEAFSPWSLWLLIKKCFVVALKMCQRHEIQADGAQRKKGTRLGSWPDSTNDLWEPIFGKFPSEGISSRWDSNSGLVSCFLRKADDGGFAPPPETEIPKDLLW